MKNSIDNYGRIAGRIWRTLDKYGPINERDLVRKIRLNKNDLYAGIGWLARENKIWDTLNTYRDINVSSIAKISQLKTEDACTALGWLAREDKLKINFVKKETKYDLK